MPELVEFLKARLDEDEATSRRIKSRWRLDDGGVILASDGQRAEQCAEAHWEGVGEHIVRHDPMRVLAEVAVKRQMLDLHERTDCRGHDRPFVQHGAACTYECSLCGGDPACQSLRLMALPYVDHPDYRDEWRPQ